jgi:hypothetical protein
MAPYPGSQYSFAPASFLLSIGAVATGQTVNLAATDPELHLDLGIGNQNNAYQEEFSIYSVPSVDLQLGGTPIQNALFLASDDLNSDFGILGDNLLNTDDYLYRPNDDGVGTSALYLIPEASGATWVGLACLALAASRLGSRGRGIAKLLTTTSSSGPGPGR